MRESPVRRELQSVTQRLDEVVDAFPPIEDKFVTATVRNVLERVEW